MILILATIYILILVFDLPALLRNRWYKEIAVFTVLLIISIYMGMVQLYDWPFFNPWDALLPMFEEMNM